MPFPTLLTIVLHMATAAFSTLLGDYLIVIRHLVQLSIYIRLLHNSESRRLSEQITGFIASLVGSNRRSDDFFYFFFHIINILHHMPLAKKEYKQA